MKLTKQEMFDRAYRGLASQGWKRSVGPRGCAYLTHDGRRCAWGWVDESLDEYVTGAVDTIVGNGHGIAASLDGEMLDFAMGLQSAHDTTDDLRLQRSMERFARDHSLSIPELP